MQVHKGSGISALQTQLPCLVAVDQACRLQARQTRCHPGLATMPKCNRAAEKGQIGGAQARRLWQGLEPVPTMARIPFS